MNPSDFSTSLEKKIFSAIYNLYDSGAKQISIFDIDNYLKEAPSSYQVFTTENGIEFLQDAIDLSDINNFDYYYNDLKKVNCLRSLGKLGFDTSKFYCDNPLAPKAEEINKKFQDMTIKDMIESLKQDILKVEKQFSNGQGNKTESATVGIRDYISKIKTEPDAGGRLQGKLFNTIVRGARKGKFYIRSAGTGVGKTRNSVGDACYLSYPIRYSWEKGEWEYAGGCEKSLIIVTEQTKEEVQSLILAYLTGINEEKILFGSFNDEEERIIGEACYVMDTYDNIQITVMPTPNIAQVQLVVREQSILGQVDNVFYDYIFSNPALLNEFRDLKIREDVALGMFSSALKDLAVEENIFILSSTQTNANNDQNTTTVRNESVVRGARSIVDKGDMACVIARPSQE